MQSWTSNTAFGSCQVHFSVHDVGGIDNTQFCCPTGSRAEFHLLPTMGARSTLRQNRIEEPYSLNLLHWTNTKSFVLPKSFFGFSKVSNISSGGWRQFKFHRATSTKPSNVSKEETPRVSPVYSQNYPHNTSDPRISRALPSDQSRGSMRMKHIIADNGIDRERTNGKCNSMGDPLVRASKRRPRKWDSKDRNESHIKLNAFGKTVLYGPARDRRCRLAELKEGKNVPVTDELNDVLTSLCRTRRMEEAHDVLDALTSMPLSCRESAIHNVKTYTIMIDICGKSRQLPRAFTLFYGMQQEGLLPNVITFNSIIAACARCNEPELAFEMFKEMEDASVRPDKFTFGALIDSCAKTGKVDLAFQLAELMDARNIEKDQTIYSALMDACGRARQVDRAFSVYEDMKKAGVFPNLITFSLLIDTCGNAREPEKAFYIFAEAKHWGFPRANVVVYTALIDACSKGGWPEQAREVFESMLRDKILPNAITFGAYIDAWNRAGRLDEAFAALHDMIHKHRCEPNAVLLGGLIDTSRRLREYHRAKQVWEVMVQFNVRVSRIFYPALMAMASRNGDLDVAVGIAFYILGSGYLRRCGTKSEDVCSRVLANALIHVWHMINCNQDGDEAREMRQSRMKVIYDSTALTEDEMRSVDVDKAFEMCVSWGDVEQTRSDFPKRRGVRIGSSRARQARELGLHSLRLSRSLSRNPPTEP